MTYQLPKEVTEDLDPEIIQGFTEKNDLNPKIWSKDGKLRPEVREHLLYIANDFFDSLDFNKNIKIEDIILTGSIANYNWSKFSDIDLHILINFSKINKDIELVDSYFRSKRTNWTENHNVKIYGFPLEVYFQNITEPHISSGTYSVLNDKWLHKPSKKNHKINFDIVEKKVSAFQDILKKIEYYMEEKEYKKVISLIEKVKEIIRLYRKSGLNKKEGEFSLENIVFKVLRRTNLIEKLNNLKTKAYNKLMSL